MDEPFLNEKTILVVDDNPELLTLMTSLFRGDDYNVLTATTGVGALQLSREFEGEIDLLLSDFEMPGGLSGVDLATALSLDRPQLKVLLISGYAGGITLRNREWRFLAKPFHPLELQASVSDLLLSRQRQEVFRSA